MRLSLVVLPLGALLPMLRQAQTSQPPYACEPTPEIRQALNKLPNRTDFRVPFEERIKPLRALAEKSPHDVFVQQMYQDAFRHKTALYQEFDRALLMYRSKPDDPIFRYLEARLIARFNPKKAEQMLEELIAREPGFPWPHLVIAELTERPGARDPKKVESHVRSFLGVCPSALAPYRLMWSIDDPAMIAEGAKNLRSLMRSVEDPYFLPYWRYLWDLEFRAASKVEREQVRQRVLNDLASLQKLAPLASAEWYGTIKYGADLVKEQKITDWLEEIVLRQLPDSSLAVNVERSRWERAHPRPGRDASPQEQKAYAEVEKGWLAGLQKRWPDDPGLIMDRWMQIHPGDTSLSLEERLSIADKYALLQRRSPDYSYSVPPLAIQLAGLYVKWRVRLDQVPELIQAGLRDVELEHKYSTDPSALPQEMQDRRIDPVAFTNERARIILADYYLIERQVEKARDAIQLALEDLESRASNQPESEREKRRAEVRRSQWLPFQARLAALQGEPDKALTFYQQYLQRFPRQYLSETAKMPQETKDLLEETKRLYLAQGGKEESWSDWLSAGAKPDVPKPSPLLQYTFTLPDFEAKDLNGKTWKLADLKGKATFVDIWATWCGSCRGEHPELQKLFDAVKNRVDIQVLTLSMDESEYSAESYMREKKYTFPVIVSKGLIDKLFTVAGIPQGWIVDAQGRRSSPFRLSSLERMISELEKAAK